MKHAPYSRFNDYAEPVRSQPNWYIALKVVAVITLLCAVLVAMGQVGFSFISYLVTQ